jgi:hypothetical protein
MTRLQPWIIIHQGLALYRINFTQFSRLSLSAALLSIVASIFSILSSIASCVSQFAMFFPQFFLKDLNSPLLSILSLLALALSVYISAEALLREKVIGHLAYQYFIKSPQALRTIFQENRKQLWQFWLARFFTNLKIYVILTISITISTWLGWWLVLPGIFFSTIVALESYLYGMFISVEQFDAWSALEMSKQELKPYIFQVFLISLSITILTLPLSLLVFLPLITVYFLEWQNQTTQISMVAVVHTIEALGLSIILSSVMGIIVAPFLQSVKALIYVNVYNHLSVK